MKKHLIILLIILISSVKAQQIDIKNIDYRHADSIANLYRGENLYNLPILSYKLTSSLNSQKEQFRAIYTWVCNNIETDYDYYLANKKKHVKLRNDSVALINWNCKFTVSVYKKLLKEQRTICSGYALLVKELSNLAGIKCVTVDGYGRTALSCAESQILPNHTWNAVLLDGKWYLCDATWSGGKIVIQDNKSNYIREFNDGYFLAKPELFRLNHFPLDTSYMFTKDKINLITFLNSPLIYKHALKYQIEPFIPGNMNLIISKSEKVSFSLRAPKEIDLTKIYLVLNRGKSNEIIEPNNMTYNDGVISFFYKFERSGLFDVHIKYGINNIVTYTIKIEKGDAKRK